MPTGMKVTIGIMAAALGLGLLLSIMPCSIVDATERGVVTRWGNPVRVLEPGIHFVSPIAEDVHKIDVTTQKESVQSDAASKDLQTVTATVAVNYSVMPGKVTDMWVQFRGDYKDRAIAPAVQEAVKAATAKYTAEQLITERAKVKDDITQALKIRLAEVYIDVSNVAIENFNFSASFNEAVEKKVTAEQNALAEQNNLEAAQFKAQSIRVTSEAANNDKYVELQRLEVERAAIEKWNGTLPVNMYGGAPVPFINVSN
jgi:prohibitin 2